MSITRISPTEAHRRALEEGCRILDVRSVREFEQGHPPGAINIPILDFVAGGTMAPNPDFTSVVQRTFSAQTPIAVLCRSGRRSLMAAEQLTAAGMADVVDIAGGFHGNPPGREPGWLELGLDHTLEAGPGETWASLKPGG